MCFEGDGNFNTIVYMTYTSMCETTDQRTSSYIEVCPKIEANNQHISTENGGSTMRMTETTPIYTNSVQDGAPSVIRWLIIPLTIDSDISTINIHKP